MDLFYDVYEMSIIRLLIVVYFPFWVWFRPNVSSIRLELLNPSQAVQLYRPVYHAEGHGWV